MLHARHRGETFGLACAEFAAAGRKVLTWTGSPEKAHFDHLGQMMVGYDNAEQLLAYLSALRRSDLRPEEDLAGVAERFSPENVMSQFQEVFL